MISDLDGRIRWMIVLGELAASVMCLWLSAFSLTQAIIGHGGGAGNVLRIGFGVLSLFVGLLFLILGAGSWRSGRGPSSRDLA